MAKQKKCPPCDCKGGLPLWMGTFGDLMSLLLTFFVLLLSMATFDKKRVEAAIGSLEGSLSVLEEGRETEIQPPKDIKATPIENNEDTPETVNVFASLITEYNEMSKVAHGPSIKLQEAESGFVIQVPGEILFDSGSAEIRSDDGRLFIKRLALELNKLSNDMHIRVTGHTDSVPLSGSGKYSDNWQLSAARGITVVKELIKSRVLAQRVSSGGAGEYQPISTNQTSDGRAKNRRVDIYVFSTDVAGEDAAKGLNPNKV